MTILKANFLTNYMIARATYLTTSTEFVKFFDDVQYRQYVCQKRGPTGHLP